MGLRESRCLCLWSGPCLRILPRCLSASFTAHDILFLKSPCSPLASRHRSQTWRWPYVIHAKFPCYGNVVYIVCVYIYSCMNKHIIVCTGTPCKHVSPQGENAREHKKIMGKTPKVRSCQTMKIVKTIVEHKPLQKTSVELQRSRGTLWVLDPKLRSPNSRESLQADTRGRLQPLGPPCATNLFHGL